MGLFLTSRLLCCCTIWIFLHQWSWAITSPFTCDLQCRKNGLEVKSNLQAVSEYNQMVSTCMCVGTHTSKDIPQVSATFVLVWNSYRHKNGALPVITVVNYWNIWWTRSSWDNIWSIHHMPSAKLTFLWAVISDRIILMFQINYHCWTITDCNS